MNGLRRFMKAHLPILNAINAIEHILKNFTINTTFF